MKINRAELESGILELGLNISEVKVGQLIDYVNLLYKWNKTYSLTAITKSDEVLKYHLLDGLTVISYISQVISVIDVGSGMGVPGIIIAICCPQIQVVAIDSNKKKSVFLKKVAIELDLKNLTVINQRVENYIPSIKFNVIISRAFASINLFIKLTKHLRDNDGYWLAMKGAKAMDTCDLGGDYKVEFLDVRVPNTELERKLLKIQPIVGGAK